jgi:hypothetical protein
MSLGRIVAWVGLVIGVAILLLQFWLAISLRLGTGDNLLGALWYFFTFFTILTNGLVVLVYLSVLTTGAWLNWWRRPTTRAMIWGSITVVGVFYHVLLAGLWSPTGWSLLANNVLHYVAPTVYVVWWLAFQPHGSLSLRDVPAMTIYPFAYLAWAMLRGTLVGEYPYPILEANTLGYGQVALNCLIMVVLFVAIFAVAVGLDRLLGRIVARPA